MISLRTRILDGERQSIRTKNALLGYISRVGMVHQNTSKDSRSVGNVLDDSLPRCWSFLWELVESREILFCRALKSKTTYASPQVAGSLISLAEDRFSSLGFRQERIYEAIQVDGPITCRRLSELYEYPRKVVQSTLAELVDRLTVTVFERGRRLTDSWSEYAYYTVDEWLLDHAIEASDLHPTEEDEEIVLLAAVRCLVTNDSKELSRALRWPIEQVHGCMERISVSEVSGLMRTARIVGQDVGRGRDNRR